jgi:hypothetical protein
MDPDEREKKMRERWRSGNTWGIVGIFFLILAGSRFGSGGGMNGSEIVTGQPVATTTVQSNMNVIADFDPRDATYVIEGVTVTLVDGISEQVIPNSSSKIITRYFGNGALGDLNADSKDDMAYYVTQELGGTGIFYYVVAALNTGSATYRITNTVLIGDRIAPQPTEIRGGKLYINYADRKIGEPMTTAPSVGVTKVLDVNSQSVLGEY